MTTTRSVRKIALVGASLASVLAIAACGSGNSNSSSSGASSSGPNWTQTGPINYVQGKDTSGKVQSWLDIWNKAHPDQKVTLIELSDQADQQRASMIQNAQNKGASGYDVLSVDVVWTAEFAANGVIQPLPSDMSTAGYLPAAVDSATYFNKLYAFPSTSDGALLYYRTDLLKAANISGPPTTWDQLKSDCTKIKAMPGNSKLICYGGQFQKYEGLTCNIAEWINSAGGQFLTPDGKPDVNSAAAMKGVDTLAAWFKDGTIDQKELTWTEEPSRTAFESGQLIFLRNWPYVYTLAQTDATSMVKGKFAVAPIPGLTGPGVSTLGGHNMGVSTYAKNLGTVKAFILWWNNEEQQKAHTIATSNAPTLTSLYTDPTLVKQFPYLTTLYDSIKNAKPRPKAVKYGDVTSAIQDATYSVISGSSDATTAFNSLQNTLTTLTQS